MKVTTEKTTGEQVGLLDIEPIEFPLTGSLGDSQRLDTIRAGWGACKSCGCTGYVRGATVNICKCGHHYSQHK
jgi:hypothetical protein